jgi:hypothetical protein
VISSRFPFMEVQANGITSLGQMNESFYNVNDNYAVVLEWVL